MPRSLRIAWQNDVAAVFRRQGFWGGHEPTAEELRAAWLEQSVLLTEKMAPALYSTARAIAGKLGLDEPIELYQAAQPGGWLSCGHANLHLGRARRPIQVRMIGPLAMDTTLFAVGFGHEVGHYIDFATDNMGAAVHGSFEPARTGEGGAARLLALASELTADRYALAGVGDLDTALRAEVAFISGLGSGVGDDPRGYLDDCKRQMEARLATGQQARGRTHPEHALRAYAHWLFAESDLFHELTGRGDRRFTIAEVDARLGKLVGVSDVVGAQRSVVTSPPTSRPAGPASEEPDESARPRGAVDRIVDGVKRAFGTRPEPEPVYDDSPVDLSDLGDDLADRFAELEKREREKKRE